jgi:hypothetical protein
MRFKPTSLGAFEIEGETEAEDFLLREFLRVWMDGGAMITVRTHGGTTLRIRHATFEDTITPKIRAYNDSL